MAPTICDDEFDTSIHRHRHHRPYSVISYVGRNSSYKQNADGLTRPNGRFQLNAVRNIQTERNETSSKSNEHCDISHKISRRRKLEDVENRSSNDIVYDLSKRPKLHESNGPNERRACPAPIEDPLPPASPMSMSASAPTSTCTDKMLLYHRLTLPPPPHSSPAQQRTLVEIAIKTIDLLRRNQKLHERLERLQMETQHFVNAVMSNPENAPLKQVDEQSPKPVEDDNST